MQSRYDTQREEWALQCEILERQLHRIDKVLSQMTQLERPVEGQAVSLGSVLRLRIDGGDLETYILLDDSAGFRLDGIMTLSAKSPVGRAVRGARPGDTIGVEVGGRVVQVEVDSVGR